MSRLACLSHELAQQPKRKPFFIDPLVQDESRTRYCHFSRHALIGFPLHVRHYNKLLREDLERQKVWEQTNKQTRKPIN